MGREFEMKYAARPSDLEAIGKTFSGFRQIRMQTTYFDTLDGSLSKAKATLRLRQENDITVCTLKTPLPDGSRGEWECPAEDIHTGIRALLGLGAPAALLSPVEANLIPVCGARFTRLAAEVPTADGTAELALDQGVLLGGGREIPLCEVEVELKSGSDGAALAFARQLAQQFGLSEEKYSKFRRAMDLAAGE